MLCSPRTFHYLSRDWEHRNRPTPLCGNWRVNALLPFGSWKRRESRARELAATKAKMCLSLWRKATSAPQPTQVPVDFPVVPNVPLLRTPGPSFFPVSDHCPRGFPPPPHPTGEQVILKPYLVSPVSPRLLQCTVSAHLSLSPGRLREVSGERAPYGRGPRGSGQSCLAEISPLYFPGHLQIPLVVEDVRQPATWRPRGHWGTEAQRSGRV